MNLAGTPRHKRTRHHRFVLSSPCMNLGLSGCFDPGASFVCSPPGVLRMSAERWLVEDEQNGEE